MLKSSTNSIQLLFTQHPVSWWFLFFFFCSVTILFVLIMTAWIVFLFGIVTSWNLCQTVLSLTWLFYMNTSFKEWHTWNLTQKSNNWWIFNTVAEAWDCGEQPHICFMVAGERFTGVVLKRNCNVYMLLSCQPCHVCECTWCKLIQVVYVPPAGLAEWFLV